MSCLALTYKIMTAFRAASRGWSKAATTSTSAAKPSGPTRWANTASGVRSVQRIGNVTRRAGAASQTNNRSCTGHRRSNTIGRRWPNNGWNG